jgi:hypothetical protein
MTNNVILYHSRIPLLVYLYRSLIFFISLVACIFFSKNPVGISILILILFGLLLLNKIWIIKIYSDRFILSNKIFPSLLFGKYKVYKFNEIINVQFREQERIAWIEYTDPDTINIAFNLIIGSFLWDKDILEIKFSNSENKEELLIFGDRKSLKEAIKIINEKIDSNNNVAGHKTNNGKNLSTK